MREKISQQNAQEIKDEIIVASVQAGKFELFGALVERYEKKIKRYGRKFLADREDINDIAQNVFLKAYENIKSFDTKRKFSTWLYRIAHNELINAAKKKKNSLPLFDLDTFLPSSLWDRTLEQNTDLKEMAPLVDFCLDNLTPKYREPVILYYFENLDSQEISNILEVPISTVGIRIKRAKEKMKKICEKLEYKL